MQQPVITIFCAFTRLGMLNRWLKDLDSLALDQKQTNLAFIIDGVDAQSDENDGKRMYALLMNYINNNNYRKFLITHNDEHVVNEVNITIRRKRIAEVKEQSKAMIEALDGIYVLSLEDDSVFMDLDIYRLLQPFYTFDNKIGFVTGYQCGRWFKKMVGIWDITDSTASTMLPHSTRVYERIDAAGFYYYLTTKENYLSHNYYTETWQPWGPDVNFGLDLVSRGYTNYVDWLSPVGHDIGDMVIWPRGNLHSESFVKTGHNEWQRIKTDD